MMVAAMAIGLVACETQTPVEGEAETVAPRIEIENARLMLPPVSGNPAAVYFDLTYNGQEQLSITGAEVKGAANTEMHETVMVDQKMQMGKTGPIPLTKGEPISFEPGAKHIMAFDLDESVTAGGTAQVSVLISGGETHTFAAQVKAAGDDR